MVGYHESLLNNALGTLPVVYSRYVDECVAIFETKGSALDFMCLLNRMHPLLTLTMEEENDYRLWLFDMVLPFSPHYIIETLPLQVCIDNGRVIQRPKIALICSLVTRAKRICSPSLLSEESDKLRDIFISTGYPLNIIDRYMQYILRDRQVFFGPNNCGLSIVPPDWTIELPIPFLVLFWL